METYQVEVVLCDLKENSNFVVEEKRFNMNISHLFLIVGTTDWINLNVQYWLFTRDHDDDFTSDHYQIF